MALLPIISNFPLFKIFKPNDAASSKQAVQLQPAADKTFARDVLDISPAAYQKLNDRDLGQIQALATQTKKILEEAPVSLGLDPNFA